MFFSVSQRNANTLFISSNTMKLLFIIFKYWLGGVSPDYEGGILHHLYTIVSNLLKCQLTLGMTQDKRESSSDARLSKKA